MDQRYQKFKTYVCNYKLDFCCWFFPVRTGLIMIGCFNVIYSLTSLMGISDDSFRPMLIKIQNEDAIMRPIPTLAYASELACNVVLLCGLYRRDQKLMWVYVRYCVVSIITDVMLYSIVATLGVWTTAAMVSNILFQIYVLILVQSTIVDYRLLKMARYKQFPMDYITSKPENDVIVIRKPEKEIVLYKKPETIKVIEIPEPEFKMVSLPPKEVKVDIEKPNNEIKVDVEIPPKVLKVDVETPQKKTTEEKPRKHTIWSIRKTKKTEEKVEKSDDKIEIDKHKDKIIVAEKPEDQIHVEKAIDSTVVAKPLEKVVVVEKPEDEIVVPKPINQVVVENPKVKITDKIVVADKPERKVTIAKPEKNVVIEKPQEKVIEKPDEKAVIKNPVDKAVIEKPIDKEVVIEKSEDAGTDNIENANIEETNQETEQTGITLPP